MIVCKELDYNYFRYMAGIYTRPLLCGIPLLALAFWMKWVWLTGSSLPQLITAVSIIGTLGFALSFFFCVSPDHRGMLIDTARKRIGLASNRLGDPEVPLAVVSNAGDVGN